MEHTVKVTYRTGRYKKWQETFITVEKGTKKEEIQKFVEAELNISIYELKIK